MTTPSQQPTTGQSPAPEPPRGPFRRAGVIRRHRARFRPTPSNGGAARQRRGQVLFSLVCLALLTTSLLSGFTQSALAIQQTSKMSQPAPFLAHMIDTTTPVNQFVVGGRFFTPGAKVYIAVYDQAGRQLFDGRYVNATKRVTPYEAGILNNRGSQNAVATDGGDVRTAFTNLCGAAVMLRALDLSTSRWTGFLTAEPQCGLPNAAEIADDLDAPLKLPVANPEISAFAIAHGQQYLVDPPLLSRTDSGATGGAVTFTGVDFTAGGRVYIALYDQMGRKLMPNVWRIATPVYALDQSAGALSTQTPRLIKTAHGTVTVSFSGLCGSDVMARAYDAGTETWSAFVNVHVGCDSPYGPYEWTA